MRLNIFHRFRTHRTIVIGIFIFFFGRFSYEFIREYSTVRPPYSPVPFWQDNRTYQTGRLVPKPIRMIDEVNLSNLTLAISACCRNVHKYLIDFQRNIRAIGQLFRSYRLYVSESDSIDGTLKFLQEWQKNDSKHIYLHTAGRQRLRMFFRTQRLAYCRNHLLDQIRIENPFVDYLMVVDVDVTSAKSFDVSNFLRNFVYDRSSWAAMSASQTGIYYDVWALRSSPVFDYDFWSRGREESWFGIAWESALKRAIGPHNRGIPIENDLIDVQSAFGGATIYAGKYINGSCRYNGWKSSGWLFSREQCEHVSFNQCVRENAGGGKFFINPKFQL